MWNLGYGRGQSGISELTSGTYNLSTDVVLTEDRNQS